MEPRKTTHIVKTKKQSQAIVSVIFRLALLRSCFDGKYLAGTTANGIFVEVFGDIVDDQSHMIISLLVLYSAPSTNHLTFPQQVENATNYHICLSNWGTKLQTWVFQNIGFTNLRSKFVYNPKALLNQKIWAAGNASDSRLDLWKSAALRRSEFWVVCFRNFS